MLKAEKKQFISDMESIYNDSEIILLTCYKGLSVAKMFELRRNLKRSQVGFKVVKNKLAEIAAANSGLGDLQGMFIGPIAVAYSSNIVDAVKLIHKFAESNDNLKIIGGVLNNKAISLEEITQISKLPSFEQLRANIVSILQTPATNLVRVINAPATNLAAVINAYANKK